jgi:hypothetical protein
MSVAIFIDTNQYLKLYGMEPGKKLLELLDEQKRYIFVPAHIVDEVMRNKLSYAKKSLSDKIGEIPATDVVVPDHLLGIEDHKVTELRDILQRAKSTKEEISRLGETALESVRKH